MPLRVVSYTVYSVPVWSLAAEVQKLTTRSITFLLSPMSRPLSGAHRHGQTSIEPTPEHSTTGPPQSSSLHSASLQIIEWADEVLATLDANSNWARRRKKHVSQRASLNAGRRVTKQAQVQAESAEVERPETPGARDELPTVAATGMGTACATYPLTARRLRQRCRAATSSATQRRGT